MTQPISATSAASTAAATETAAPKIAADFDMFLKLLTAQMQYQDPLSPLDTTQYTQQLAQFSQVEQATQQNSHLRAIRASIEALGDRLAGLETPAVPENSGSDPAGSPQLPL